MSTFADDLVKAKRIPRMALRPHSHGAATNMDDIVVKDVQMFRAEAMSDDQWWLCCYFPNGERVTFWATAYHEKGKRKALLSVDVTEEPAEWIDIDEERRGVSA